MPLPRMSKKRKKGKTEPKPQLMPLLRMSNYLTKKSPIARVSNRNYLPTRFTFKKCKLAGADGNDLKNRD